MKRKVFIKTDLDALNKAIRDKFGTYKDGAIAMGFEESEFCDLRHGRKNITTQHIQLFVDFGVLTADQIYPIFFSKWSTH